MHKVFGSIATFLIIVVFACQCLAQPVIPIYVAATSSSGQHRSGPATLELYGLNRLRYDISVTVATSTAAPATPPTGSVPALIAAAGATPTATSTPGLGANTATPTPACPLCSKIGPELTNLSNESDSIKATLKGVNDTATNATSVAYALDGELATATAADYPTSVDLWVNVHVVNVSTAINQHVNDAWPDATIAQLNKDAPQVSKDVDACPGQAKPTKTKGGHSTPLTPTPALLQAAENKCKEYKVIYAGIATVITNVNASATKTTFTNNLSLLNKLNQPYNQVAAEKSAALKQSVDVPCYPSIDSSTTTDTKVTRIDRFNSDATKNTDTIDVGTIVCTSKITYSVGLVYTNLHDQLVSLVPIPNSTPAMNRIATNDTQSGQTSLMVVTNGRLLGDGEGLNLDLSAGAILNNSSSSAQSAATFVMGPTLSFNERVYLTAGYYFGKSQQLLPGYSNGQILPATTTTPPVGSVSSTRFGIGITFRP